MFGFKRRFLFDLKQLFNIRYFYIQNKKKFFHFDKLKKTIAMLQIFSSKRI